MPLCSNCGALIYDNAPTCYQCGIVLGGFGGRHASRDPLDPNKRLGSVGAVPIIMVVLLLFVLTPMGQRYLGQWTGYIVAAIKAIAAAK
jgi:hypothetical protein